MNLVDGRIVNGKEADAILRQLPQRILKTLRKLSLNPQTVIRACDCLVGEMEDEAYLAIMEEIGIGRRRGEAYIKEAKEMFSASYLRARLNRELGTAYDTLARPEEEWEIQYQPPFHHKSVREQICPLGVLVHIPAGNADGLPAFSVLEGLLTGNINILKLPEVDGGISVLLLEALIRQEPALAEYIYVFDYSSKDTAAVARLIDVADALVVWGGDVAVSALRTLAPPSVKLIEWGHKISFAYVSVTDCSHEALKALAVHICETNQLLCTSCQGIYLDTDSWEAVTAFCHEFLPVLEDAAREVPADFGIAAQAQVTLRLRTLELEGLGGEAAVREATGLIPSGKGQEASGELQQMQEKRRKLFRAERTSLLASLDSSLEPSLQFRNCWVKPLPREQMLAALRPHKSHLHTAGLLCGEKERAELTALLVRSGIVRVTDAGSMSSSYCGEPHDGEYALRRYTKTVSVR